MGSVAGAIGDVLPAKTIVDNMVKEAVDILQAVPKAVVVPAKL